MACSRAPEPRTRIFTAASLPRRSARRRATGAATVDAVARAQIDDPRKAARRAGGGALGEADRARDRATAVRYLLQLLAETAPGNSVEVRVPPFGAVQVRRRARGTRAARRRTSSRPTPRPGSRSPPAPESGRMPAKAARCAHPASGPTWAPISPSGDGDERPRSPPRPGAACTEGLGLPRRRAARRRRGRADHHGRHAGRRPVPDEPGARLPRAAARADRRLLGGLVAVVLDGVATRRARILEAERIRPAVDDEA